MSKITKRIVSLLEGLGKSIVRFPLEAALCFVYFLLWVLADSKATLLPAGEHYYYLLLWFVPQLVLLFFLHQWSAAHKWKKALYALAWFLWIPLALTVHIPEGWYAGMANLLAVLLLFAGTSPTDNDALGRRILHVGKKLAMGLVIGGVTIGLVLAVLGSVSLLFDLNLSSNWYSYSAVFVMMVPMPLLCISLISEEEESLSESRFWTILIDYVLSPALVLYTLILYGYIIRILVNWQLPEGGVAYMILAYLSIGLLCYLLRLQISRRHFDWFFQAFPFLAVAPLVLLWAGSFRRIGDYGLTELRFYLLVLCVLSTLFVLMLFWKRTRSFHWMILLFGTAAVLFTYIPGIRAHDFGIRGQQKRFDALLPQLLEEGKFPETYNYDALKATPELRQTLMEAYESWQYLYREMKTEDLKKRYETYGGFFKFNRSQAEGACSYEPEAIWTIKAPLSLEDYSEWLPKSAYHYYEDAQKVIFYRDKTKREVLLECPIREQLDAANEDTLPEKVLIYRNETYLAVFPEIRDYGRNQSPSFIIPHLQLFRKP